MYVDGQSLSKLEMILCTPAYFDTEKFGLAFRTKKFTGYHSFTAGSSDSVYDERRWLYIAHFSVGMIERFKNEVIVLFPKVMTDEGGNRKVERPIEVRVGGNLGPIGVTLLLGKIARELENNNGASHLVRNQRHQAITSIRT